MPKPATPLLTADAVILVNNQRDIVLIRRKNPPFQGIFALPGGFVDEGELIDEKIIQRIAALLAALESTLGNNKGS